MSIRRRVHPRDHSAGNDASGEAAGRLEEQSRLLLDLTHDAVFVRDMDGRIRYWNHGAEDLFGWTADEALGQVAHELLQTVWPEPFADIAARLLRTGRWQGEVGHTRRDGTRITVAARWALQRDTSGNPVAHFVTANDITEQKQAVEALRESEARYRALIEVSPQIVWTTPGDGSTIYVNQQWYDYTGLRQPETEAFEPIHPEHRRRMWQSWRQNLASGVEWSEEAPLRRGADGQYRWHLLRGRPIRDADGRIVRWVGIAIDIHDRREAEEALGRSEAWLSEAQRLGHTGSWVLDLETGTLKHWSPELLRICGFDPEAGIPSIEAVRERVHPEDRSKYDEEVATAIRERRGVAGERRLVLPDGTIRQLQSVVSPVFDAAGRAIEVIGTAMDVTERKRAEEALRESEERYRALIDVSPQMVWVARADGANIFWNQRWYDYTGLTREQSEGFDWMQAVHPDHRAKCVEFFQHALASGAEWSNEAPVRRAADGQYRWHLGRGLPIRDADGRIVRWMGICVDIHDRREAEEALRRSEAWLSEAQRLSHTGSWAIDPVTREPRHASPEILRIFGFDPDEGIPPTEVIVARLHPEDQSRFAKEMDAAIRERRSYTADRRLVLPDGTIRHIHAVSNPEFDAAGHPIEFIGTVMDVTERKQAEEALRESEQRYRALVDVSPEFVWLARADGYNIFWNQRWYDYTGLTRAESEGFGWVRAVHPEYRDRLVDLWRRALASGDEWNNEAPLRRADGQYRWHVGRGLPIRDADGRIVRWIGIGIDIHDRREAEEALRESEQRYRNIFEKVGVAIVEEDFSKVMARLGDLKARGVQDFRRHLAEHPELARETFASITVTDLNEAAVALFGAASKQEFLDAVPRLATREVRAAWVAQLLAVAEGRRSIEEVVLTTIGGETVHALVTLVLPPESSGFESVLVTVVDLSDRKRAEEALNHAQAALAHMTRITTLGELTASIAHEVNQPLAAIVNNASACLSLLSHGRADVEELRTALADINGDAERASAVVERVRAMAKRSAPDRIPVRLTELVHEVVALTRAESTTRRVAIRTDVPADLPLVLGDRVQLQQVLLNLVVNAMDAMSGADERDRSLDIRGRVDRHDGSPAVTISVKDRGVGLQPGEFDRLFEAFYTTKPHGMGLGLAISRSIIEAHGGRLWGESEGGRGAVFSFCLPAAETSRTA